MKIILLTLLTILANFYLVHSQDQRLFDVRWELSNLNLDGVDHTPPNNSEVQSVSLEFSSTLPGSFNYWVCGGDMCGTDGVFVGQDQIDVTMITCLSGGCNLPPNSHFFFTYSSFFEEYQTTSIFSYDIQQTNGGSILELAITNGSGDTAVYTSAVASVSENQEPKINFYPNPVSDRLYFETSHDFLPISVEVFDVLGRSISRQDIDDNNFDVSQYNVGRYFLLIKDDTGRTLRTSFLINRDEQGR
ncbi:MAG: T9SS type A sorting domain-containing protein [Nonlabens sp.]